MTSTTCRRWIALLTALLACATTTPRAGAQCEINTYSEKLAGVPNTGFGLGMDVDGDVAVVGAPLDITRAPFAGAAYVFRNQLGTWVLEDVLYASDAEASDFFGWHVAIDGEHVIVSAFFADSPDGSVLDTGAAYMFRYDPDRSTWSETQILRQPAPVSNDFFGRGLAIHGSRAVVGARGRDSTTLPGSDHGSLFVYELDAKSDLWTFQQELEGTTDGAGLGPNAAIEGDVIVADHQESPGTFFYEFDPGAGAWSLVSSFALESLHGEKVICGDMAISRTMVLGRRATDWVVEYELDAPGGFSDSFLLSVAKSDDIVIVGDPPTFAVERAHVFQFDGVEWVHQSTIIPFDADYGVGFGAEVGLSGETAFVAAINEGEVYVIPDVVPDLMTDCNANGVPDDCETDCNLNDVPDDCDVVLGLSPDCNFNGIPDECEEDCNSNGVPDDCDIAARTSADCNSNGVPDECDTDDCNGNGVPDSCDIDDETSLDCNGDGLPDECDSDDCNGNGIPDDCDIAAGTSDDTNGDGIPDECQAKFDCNWNGVPDTIDIADGTSTDCNLNGKPDECEGFFDCNFNGVFDACDILDGTLTDADGNGYPDECGPLEGDLNGDLFVDVVDLLALFAAWGDCPVGPPALATQGGGGPSTCPADLDGDGSVGVTDQLILLANWWTGSP